MIGRAVECDGVGKDGQANQKESSWKRAVLGWLIWISLVPFPKEAEDLIKWYLEVVELPEKDMGVGLKVWVVSAVVVRSVGRKVSLDLVATEF